MESAHKNSHDVATMGIPAINACATYSFGYSNIHRKLAKERAQEAGRVDVSEEDVAATAGEACRAYLAELEHRSTKSKKN